MWRMRNAAGDPNAPVKAKAILIDPDSMTVVWMNESASADGSNRTSGAGSGVTVEQVVPMAEALGVVSALRTVAKTGVARHLRAGVISTARGSFGITVSIYRLPDGKLLVLTENAWQAGNRKTAR